MKYFRLLFPFLITLALWRLSAPFWNPGGIFALIPIFYYSFIRPVNWFAPFAAVFCFLLDYRLDTVLFWTSAYCFLYAMNDIQNFVDLTRQKNYGIFVFMGFFGVTTFILFLLAEFSFGGFARALWLFSWLGIWYIPFAALAKKVEDD